MSRQARVMSATSIYHIILRGNNRQIIFEDNKDYMAFLDTLQFYKDVCKYKIYAYCLMDNHIHLLMEVKEDISKTMKMIENKYVWWYNQRYSRCGHLFQNRFKSEPVEDERYLLTVFRYILQNPLKAGIVKNLGEYAWSSINEYMKGSIGITDCDFMKSFFGNNNILIEYLMTSNVDYCMENIVLKKDDQLAISYIKQISKCISVSDIQKLPISERKRYIREFVKIGMSCSQISRLTGIARRTVERDLKQADAY